MVDNMKLSARISLLSLAVTATFGTMIATPAIRLLAVDFPHTSALLLQWIITISSLFILPTLFSVTYLSKRFSRKSIVLVGLLLYLIGGVGPAFVDSFTLILVFRAILGLGIGLIAPTFNGLIAESFQGQERARMNGFVSSINGIGGALFLFVGGLIATSGWRAIFLTYSFVVLLIILVIFFLPSFPPVKAQGQGDANRGKDKLPRIYYVIAIGGTIHMMLYFLIPTNLAMFLAENKIGTVSTVGSLTSLSLIGVFVSGLVMPFLIKRLRERLVVLGVLAMGAGFLCMSMAHTIWMAAIAVILIGISEGMLFPLQFMKTADVVPKLSITRAISLLLAFSYAYQFISPLFSNGLKSLMPHGSTRDMFLCIAIGLGIAAFFFVFFTARKPRQEVTALTVK
jgi:MFS family permease